MEPFALWTSQEAVDATGGRATADFVASGVSIDSRTLDYGDLFVALKGPNFDGHDYVRAAFERGASAALVSRVPAGLPEGAPLLVVGDTLAALNSLAAAARQRSGARIVAVTGSVGKTGTKEALRLLLGAQGETHAAVGSYNNMWGVPLTLARLPREAHYGVFEIGMNHAGEIEPLARLVRPHVAIVTNVEAVHLGNFPSVRAIADAKAEIFAGLGPDGVAIVNRDNPHYAHLAARAKDGGVGRVLSFGEHPESTARLVNSALHPNCSCVSAEIAGQPITYKIGSPGRHWVMNSLAVLLAVRMLDADLSLAGLKLAEMRPPKGRGQRHRLSVKAGTFELIDDSYNASPVSVRAALAVLKQATPGPRGRRIAVLGDMLELGEDAPALHAGLAPDLVGADCDLLFACGPNMRRLYDSVPERMRGHWAPTSAELGAPLGLAIRPGDVVLVKGSLGSRMGPIVEALVNPATPPLAANG